jgi:DNA-binding NarL/FixJ family response regulator
MRVLLADGHPKVRWAMRTFIQAELGFSVVGEALDADTLISQARALHPDLILLEWELVGRPVGQVLPALQALGLPAQIIVLSWQPGVERSILDAGADGFVSKANGPEALEAALRHWIKNWNLKGS